jgi:hypothetical protein
MARRLPAHLRLGLDTWSLGVEAASVIGLRMLRLAAGGAGAQVEANRMVTEKIAAAADLQRMAMTGALGSTATAAASRTLAHYRRKVRANRRRLTRD